MNTMLNVFQTFGQNFVRRMQMPSIIVALVFAIIGVSLAVLGRRVARMVRKSNNIEDNDSVLITFKAIGLVCLFISVLIVVFRGI
ncbi:MAG: hypothetical protein MR412_01395 [Firmicutes bacterium]|nr:hypothetical protein [Bacillota bacterium]MDY5676185.1 hypothetical protein [Eubacteriales bacterium]